jgi:hypothetical protein
MPNWFELAVDTGGDGPIPTITIEDVLMPGILLLGRQSESCPLSQSL